MLVCVRRSRLLLTAIGSQTGFAVSIVVSLTLLVMATAAAFGILRSGEVWIDGHDTPRFCARGCLRRPHICLCVPYAPYCCN